MKESTSDTSNHSDQTKRSGNSNKGGPVGNGISLVGRDHPLSRSPAQRWLWLSSQANSAPSIPWGTALRLLSGLSDHGKQMEVIGAADSGFSRRASGGRRVRYRSAQPGACAPSA
jgi:hypothetical protein